MKIWTIYVCIFFVFLLLLFLCFQPMLTISILSVFNNLAYAASHIR